MRILYDTIWTKFPFGNMQNYAKMVQRCHSRDTLITSSSREPFALAQKTSVKKSIYYYWYTSFIRRR